MFEDIFKKGSVCPICEKELLLRGYPKFSNTTGYHAKCINNCFSYDFVLGVKTVKIFDEAFSTYENVLYRPYSKSDIEKLINYWKENDRYLMKIMEG